MYLALTIIIILVSILLSLVVLIQNPKGGGTGAWNIGDIKGSKAMEQAYEMGKAV